MDKRVKMETIEILEKQKQESIVKVSQGLPEIIEKLKGKVITTPGEYAYFCDILKKIKERQKSIDAIRLKIVKPLNDLVGKWNDEFRPAKVQAENIRLLLNKMLSDYDDEQERLRAVEAERLKKEQEEAESEAAKVAQEAIATESDEKLEEAEKAIENIKEVKKEIKEISAPVKPTVTEYSKTSFRTDIKFEITDENAVPRSFCSPDKAKIDSWIKKNKSELDKLPIPGIKTYAVKTPITR